MTTEIKETDFLNKKDNTDNMNEKAEKAEKDNNKSCEVDYNLEYKNKLRCPTCHRKTKGEEDYRSLRGGGKKITKTCIKCRSSVIKSNRKSTKRRRPSKAEHIKGLKDIIYQVDDNLIDEIIKNNEDLQQYLTY